MGNTSLELCSEGQKTEAQKCTSSRVTRDFHAKKQRPGDADVRRPCQLSMHGLLAPNSSVNTRSGVTGGIHSNRSPWRRVPCWPLPGEGAGETLPEKRGSGLFLAVAQWVSRVAVTNFGGRDLKRRLRRSARCEDVRRLLPPAPDRLLKEFTNKEAVMAGMEAAHGQDNANVP